MIHVIFIKNSFDVSTRDVKSLPYMSGKEVQHYVKEYALFNFAEISIGVNGVKLEEDQYCNTLEDEDCIVICPKVGKGGIFKFLAVVALAVVSVGLGNIISGGTWAHAGLSAGAKMMAQIAATAIMAVGGKLMSNWLYPSQGGSALSESTTYGWNNGGNQQQQGNAIPITYGKLLVTGQLLARHIDVEGDDQYLNLLLSGGEGSLDYISDIKIDDNPIENYSGVTSEIRLGTNNQTAISNFGTTFADQFTNYELNNDSVWKSQQTEGDGGSGLEITIELPAGLYYSNDSGGLSNATVKVESQWRRLSPETTDWNALTLGSNITSSTIPNATCSSTTAGGTYTVLVYASSPPIAKIFNPDENVNSWVGGTFIGNGGDVYSGGSLNFTIPSEAGTYTITVVNNSEITAGQTQAVRRTYRVDNIGIGKYEVRTRCTYKSGTSSRYGTRVYWTCLSHITYDDFCYPNIALLGLRVLATDQLSGSQPKVTWIQERSSIQVYNPTTMRYELKPANNPAWASYDLLHRCRYIPNVNTGLYEYDVRGVPASRLIYSEFSTWADACTAKNLKINIILDVADDLWSHSMRIGEIGRGHIIMRGTKFGCFYDAPNMSPIQIFNIANIYVDTFSEDFLSIADKANAVEITFYNEENNYEAETVICYGSDYDDSTIINNPAQKTLYGCTNYAQAIRAGTYMLLLTEHLVRTVVIDADVDSIACQVGDVVAIQHDVPQWGIGGRIVSYVEGQNPTIVLDTPVTIQPNVSYTILSSAVANGKENLQFTSVVNNYTEEITTDTLPIVAFTYPPIKNGLFTFGETGKEKKLFKVIAITRSSDLKRNIQCLEYISEVYDESAIIPPNISYVKAPKPYPVNSDIKVSPNYYIQSDGTVINELSINWSIIRGADPQAYLLETSMDNGLTWNSQGRFYGKNASIKANRMGYYVVRITAIYNATASVPVISSPVNISGKDFPPSNVRNLYLLQNTTYSNIIEVSWDRVHDSDLAGYKLKQGNLEDTWDSSSFIGTSDLIITDNTFSLTVNDSGDFKLLVKAIDTSGNLSQSSASSFISIDCYPDDVSGFTADWG